MLFPHKVLSFSLRVAALISLSICAHGTVMAIALDVPFIKVTAPNGGQVIVLEPDENGITIGSATLDGDALSWNLDIANPAHPAYANGSYQIINNSGEARAYALELVIPLNAPLTNTIIGGTGKITLNTDANGGSVKCAPNATALLEQLHDGDHAAASFFCPFALSSTGAGTASTTSSYGAPIPAPASIDANATVSIAFRPLLSDGDTAIATFSAIANGEESTVTPPSPQPPVYPDDGAHDPNISDPPAEDEVPPPIETPVTTPPTEPPGGGEAQEPPPAVEDPQSPATPETPPEGTPPPGETPPPVLPPAAPESGSLMIERLKARAPKLKIRIMRDGVAATTYATELSVAGRQGARPFGCVIGELAPGAPSITAQLRLHESVRGRLEIKARAVSDSIALSASSAGKVKRVPSRARKVLRTLSCPVKLLRAE